MVVAVTFGISKTAGHFIVDLRLTASPNRLSTCSELAAVSWAPDAASEIRRQ